MSDIIVALATPAGSSALGVVRLSGRGSRALSAAFLEPGPPGTARRAELRWVKDGSARLDRVLATWFPQGGSYTGEESIEVSAHGSLFVLERLLAAAVAAGARPALPGEFTRRAYESGRLELAQAEAVCELIAARTAFEHRAALRRLQNGAPSRARALRADLLALLARVEAAIDHPDEGVAELDSASLSAEARTLADRARELERAGVRGRLRAGGARAVLVGAPNAGKSSLLNALLGRERAIVSARAGTTRDTLEEPADLGGVPVVLVDTAGLRDDPDGELECLGLARARSSISGADLAVVVLDRAAPAADSRAVLAEVRSRLRQGAAMLLALNKSDLPAPLLAPGDVEGPSVPVSAKDGSGLGELCRQAAALLAGSGEGDGEAALTLSARESRALKRFAVALEAGALEAEPELAAARLREALEAVDELLGRGAPDAVLAEVFSRFCVGK